MYLEDKNKDKRVSRRKVVSASVRYEMKSTREFGSALACDISEGGLRLNFNKFIPSNTDFLLQLNLPSAAKVINAVGKVMWAQRIPHSERYQLGISFKEMHEKQRTEISDYLNRLPEKVINPI
ncbi:MAG: PilZ domain-containing protein [Candidatus Omnitrophica bacterium]|nr:PilZ domain-containing protein [Candidatus Omnitrophota bacterium]